MQHFKPTWYNAQAVIYTLNMVGFLITNPLMIFAQVRPLPSPPPPPQLLLQHY